MNFPVMRTAEHESGGARRGNGSLNRTGAVFVTCDAVRCCVPREVVVWRMIGSVAKAVVSWAVWWPERGVVGIFDVREGVVRPVRYATGKSALAVVSGMDDAGIWERVVGSVPAGMTYAAAVTGTRIESMSDVMTRISSGELRRLPGESYGAAGRKLRHTYSERMTDAGGVGR